MNTQDFKLIAATFTDGYGIVADDKGEVYLVKPPFDFFGKEHLPYEQITPTINHFGFVELSEHYHSWEEIFSRLRQIAWETRRQVGDIRPNKISEEDRKDFFKTMPKDFLISPIEKMEVFLKERKFVQAIFIGEALLENPNLVGEFRDRVMNTLQQAKNQQSIALSKFSHLSNLSQRSHFTPTLIPMAEVA